MKKIYFIISISDKELSSFFISFILLLFFSFLLIFFVLILSYLSGTCILFCQHNWTELFFLFWMCLSGTFFQVGGRGGGCTCTQRAPPPAYAPAVSAFFERPLCLYFTAKTPKLHFCNRKRRTEFYRDNLKKILISKNADTVLNVSYLAVKLQSFKSVDKKLPTLELRVSQNSLEKKRFSVFWRPLKPTSSEIFLF